MRLQEFRGGWLKERICELLTSAEHILKVRPGSTANAR